MQKILGLLAAVGVIAVNAESLVFYDFAEGTAGASVASVPNRGTAGATYDGTPAVAGGGAVTYSDDVPGLVLYPDHDSVTPLSENWKSLEFTVDGGNGAIVSVPGLGARLCEIGMEGDFTIEFFAKFPASQSWTDFVKFYFEDELSSNRQAKYVLWNSSFGLQNTEANPTAFAASANLWYHLAAVYTVADGTWRMYCNGALYAVQPNKILGAGSTVNLTLGGQNASYEAFAGKLAALRISSGALAPAQFMKVANGETPTSPGAVAFYPFDEAAPGTAVAKVDNAMDALLYAGTASRVADGAMPVYSADVPGYWVYSDIYYTNLLSSSANSVQFARAEGVDNSGGLLTLSQLATAMSAFDEGTVEFFAESDANLSWRNMVTFNAGQSFKICYSGSTFQFQNFWVYNAPDSCLPVNVPAATGKWLHAAMTWSKADNRAQCYMNYEFKGSVYLTNATTTASRSFFVGGSGSNAAESFCGKVFGLRISSRALDPAQMLHVTTFPMHGDGVLVSKDGVDSTTVSTVIVDEGKRLKIRGGVALTASIASYAGATIPAGVYTGEAGAPDATVVPWIEGAGTLTVMGASDTSIWTTIDSGNWSEAGKWSGALLPRAGHPAAVNVPMPISYTVTVDAPTVAPAKLSIANGATDTATVSLAAGGSMEFDGAQISVDRGGVLQVAGGDLHATNTSVTVEDGGTVRVTGGTFKSIHNTANAFCLKQGALLELAGGATEILHGTKNESVFDMKAGSRLVASGDATLDLRGAFKMGNYLRGGEILFRDNAHLTVSHCGFGALSGTQTVTFRDQASLTMRDDAVLTFGGNIPGAIEANFDSAAQTIVPYGVIVGTTAGATLNIRNGHYMRGEGNWNAIGSTYNSCPKGTLNVYNGAFVQRSNPQWADCPYGITVGENKGNSSTRGVGVLNVYPDGVVSNLTTGTAVGQGVYLRVGSGKNGDGTINQYGGEVYHNSNLGCLIGAWGGTGRWNVCSGGVATVLCDVYVGGAETNSLIAFGPSADRNNGRGNGGESFGKAYDAFALSTGTLSIEDGTFTTPSNLYVSALGTGTVRMGPAAAARLAAKNVVLGCTSKDGEDHNSTVAFRFAKESTGTIAVAEKLTIAAGTKLVLDFSGYEQGRTVRFPLITYATREGGFDAADIEIVGEEPKGGKLMTDVACTGGLSYQYVIARGTTIIVR